MTLNCVSLYLVRLVALACCCACRRWPFVCYDTLCGSVCTIELIVPLVLMIPSWGRLHCSVSPVHRSLLDIGFVFNMFVIVEVTLRDTSPITLIVHIKS